MNVRLRKLYLSNRSLNAPMVQLACCVRQRQIRMIG
jgi:hypothetical protein